MRSQVPDKQLSRSVNMKLSQRSGGSGCKITAVVASGSVTLSGFLLADYQRRTLVNAINGISGVHRVIDQMQVAPKQKRTDA